MRRFLLFLCLLTLSLWTGGPVRAEGMSFIRDTETEAALRLYTAPIFRQAGLDPEAVQFHLVNSQGLNAFVANGQRIFVHVGILMKTDGPEEVIGVLAHETGHISGGHIARTEQGRQEAEAKMLAAMLLGIPLGLATGQGDVVGASMALGRHVGNRTLLRYSRGMEQAADQAALSFLDGVGWSARGLLTFMERLGRREGVNGVNAIDPYVMTHPLTRDRMTLVRNHLRTATHSSTPLPPEFQRIHLRIQAKLRGFLLPPEEVDALYPPEDVSLPARYARAVSLMRRHDVTSAVKMVDALLSDYPDDPYFHELKGDILFRSGSMRRAAIAYENALARLPEAPLIQQAAARALIEQGGKTELERARIHLTEALRQEPRSVFSWRLLATAQGRLGNMAEASLALAEEAVWRGRSEAAEKHARQAVRLSAQGSATRLRAQDILAQSEQGRRRR